jgi:Flp pilus assembly pilin Flp
MPVLDGRIGANRRKGMVLAYIRALDVLKGRLRRQEGQALVEYALIISLIAVALIGALTFMSGKMDGIFSDIGNKL